jgi:predicted nucleic acid-binding protein
VSLYYADTSAVIKLLAEETHSAAFATFYDTNADAEWVSSALLRIEVTRTVSRAMPSLLPDARDLLLAFSYIAIDDDVVEGAISEPDRGLRSLDAIHLATARILGEDLNAIVSYDDRLLKAASDAGMTTLTPRDEQVHASGDIGSAGSQPGSR